MKSKPLIQLPTSSAFQLVRPQEEKVVSIQDASSSSNKDSLSRKNSVYNCDVLRPNSIITPSPNIMCRPRILVDFLKPSNHSRGFNNFDTFSRQSSQKSIAQNNYNNPKSIGNTPQMMWKPKISPFPTKPAMLFERISAKTPMFGDNPI